MTRAELLALAERMEAATGPSRLLMLDISDACDMETPHGNPTASLDAAMSLVPDGYSILMVWNGRDSICHVHAQPIGVDQNWPDPGIAKTPALALTAAALRARASMIGEVA